jgi:hypothetical protein
METIKLDNIDIYQIGYEIEQVGNYAIDKAVKENKKLGIPTVFSVNGKLVFQSPCGKIITKNPF